MAAETYECILSGTLAGQFVQNILHAGVDNTASTDPFTVAGALLTEFNSVSKLIPKWLDCLPDPYTLTSVRVRRILPTGGPTNILLQGSISGSIGTRTGNTSVVSNAPLLIWLSSLRPSKTGRTFLPGVSESDVDNNVLDGGLVAAMESLGAYWSAGGTLASPSYNWDGQIYRRAVAAGDAISHYRVSPIIGNQRRRQRPI